MKKNIYENLAIKDYEDEFDFIEEFIKEVNKLEYTHNYSFVSVYGKSEFIYDVFKLLTTVYDFEIGYVDFARDYFDEDYAAEYCLRVNDDKLVVVEKSLLLRW